VKYHVDALQHWVTSILIGLIVYLLIDCGGMDPQPVRAQNILLQGNIYYVAPTGSDSDPGTLALPWRTIQKAAQTMVAGDTVYIRAGTYHEQVVPVNSGSPGGYITYAAYPGEMPSLDGSDVALRDALVGLFDLSHKGYIRISGLRVTNVAAHSNNGGILAKYSSNIIIEGNRTYNTISSGIGVWNSQNVIVDGNRVEHANTGGKQECLTMAGTSSFQVSHNEILDCRKEGIDIKDGSSDGRVFGNDIHQTASFSIYVDAYSKHTFNIQVYRNLIHDNYDFGITLSSERGGLLENVYVYNNIIYHNRYSGIWLSPAGPGNSLGQHPIKNISIINNTIYNNGWTDYGGGINVSDPNAQEVIIRNNLVSQNLSFQIKVDPKVQPQNVTIDHNLIDRYRGYPGETYGSAFVTGDPLFVDPATNDLHLQAGSPAIDAGSAGGAPVNDYDGNLRPRNGNGDAVIAYDIGAFEVVRLPSCSLAKRSSSARWLHKRFTLAQCMPDRPF
jgi:hypothetical protein